MGNSKEISLTVGNIQDASEIENGDTNTTVVAELRPDSNFELTQIASMITTSLNAHNRLTHYLNMVITAAEIIDGQSSPPADDDVEHLHDTIAEARAYLSEL